MLDVRGACWLPRLGRPQMGSYCLRLKEFAVPPVTVNCSAANKANGEISRVRR